MLIVAGSLKQAADYISFYHLGFSTVNDRQNPHYLWPYFFGGILGTALVGPLYDFCHSGAGYLALNTLTIITITGQVFSIIVLLSGKTGEDYVTTFESCVLFMYGMLEQMTEFYIMLMIPLIIASKTRVFHEFTKAGTVLSVVNGGYIFFLYTVMSMSTTIDIMLEINGTT
jgi:hypothetical protein